MSRRYHLDDLIRLRDSPLVSKPTSLPPQEEWMGASQDVTARRTSAVRGKPEDTTLQEERFGKRPSILDHTRKSGTGSVELFLGPRKFGRKSTLLDEGDDNPKPKDTSNNNEQSKPSEESRDRFGERRGLGSRPEGLNGRFSQRPDGDGFQNGRFQRKDQRDEAEPRTRQEVDELRERPRWRTRNGQEDTSAFDDDKEGTGENGRAGTRRDVPARTRFEQPWFRNDKASDSPGERRGESRQQEWRKDNNRDWDRSARPEADPEWMDAGDIDEPAQAHTQEDFQRWKERMKAGGTPAEDKSSKPATDSAAFAEVKKVATAPATLIPSDEMDKFFARFNESKDDQDQKPQAKLPTKTRFAALWNAPSDPAPSTNIASPTAQALPQAPPPQTQAQAAPQASPNPQAQTPSQADADQAGFARILQMLGSRSQNTTPQELVPQKVRASQPPRQEQAESQDRMKSPDSNQLMAEFEQHSRHRTGRKQESMGFERPVDSRSPIDGVHLRQESGSNKETSEILLNLMRQANLGSKVQASQAQSNESRQQQTYGLAAENVNRNVAPRNHQTSANIPREPPMPHRRETQSNFFDEPLVHSMSYPDEQSMQDFQHNGVRRRPTNGPPMPFLDDQLMPAFRQLHQPPANALSSLHMQSGALPPGLHRPPGLDQMQRPPPGWPSQQQQAPQQQPPSRQAPPPGIPNLPRGMNLPFGNNNPNMQIPPHLQQQQQQPPPPQGLQRPQRKYTGDSGLGFPPLGGMAPPSGFMNPGPPPGFQGAPQNYGRFQAGNEPQGMPRSVGDLYERDRHLLRGGPGPAGNGMPPSYR